MNKDANCFLTLVASAEPLSTVNVEGLAEDLLSGDPEWLSEGYALDIPISCRPENLSAIQNQQALSGVDVFFTAAKGRRKQLLLADMDSTIVQGETLDELAAFADITDHIAAITARAMNGALDFHEALRERVRLLEGLPEDALAKTLEGILLSPGAEVLVQTMKAHGATCVLVSGGFTVFTDAIAKACGFDFHHGNVLNIEDGLLTGTVAEPILDRDAKLEFLKHHAGTLEIGLEDALTIGDGANDLAMLGAAGLGLGYHAKTSVAIEIDNNIRFGDLTAALYAQGYKDTDFVEDEE